MNIGHPWFNRHSGDPHWARLPDALKQQILDHVAELTDVDIGEPCIWYNQETRQCSHYEFRPQMCRDFEAGNDHCLRLREKYGIESPLSDRMSQSTGDES